MPKQAKSPSRQLKFFSDRGLIPSIGISAAAFVLIERYHSREPMKVRLSRKGDTVMVFLNQKTVMMFSTKFLDAVINRKYQKEGA